MTHLKLWLTPSDYLAIPAETYEEDSEGGLDMLDASGEVIATAAAKTWLLVLIVKDESAKLIPPAERQPHQIYEPCVVGAGGRCTRASHDHSDEIGNLDT